MVSQKLLRKSSANYLVRVEFSQKGFVDLDFGHHQCPFLRNFSTLVQIRIEKITKLFYVMIMYFWQHNGHTNYWSEKSEFLDRNILHMWHWKMHILVLATKTEICNLATINDADVICHTIMHRMSCDDFVVHISVLLLKQNICWHHKHF